MTPSWCRFLYSKLISTTRHHWICVLKMNPFIGPCHRIGESRYAYSLMAEENNLWQRKITFLYSGVHLALVARVKKTRSSDLYSVDRQAPKDFCSNFPRVATRQAPEFPNLMSTCVSFDCFHNGSGRFLAPSLASYFSSIGKRRCKSTFVMVQGKI
jgi:hypothetical protein